MNPPQIRDATPADYATYLRLFPELGVDDPPASRETFVASFAPTMVFASRNGEELGYAYFRLADGTAHLGQIATVSTARRQGVGRALMTTTIERAKQLGAKTLQLNVMTDNAPAIALYESFGLRATDLRIWALRMHWATIMAQPGPFEAEARPLDPAEDAAWESRLSMQPGLLARARRLPTRIFRVIDDDALIGFDPEFIGAFPLHAPDAPRAFSLLHAVHDVATPQRDSLNLTLESDAHLMDVLLAAGAHLRFEMLRLHGPI